MNTQNKQNRLTTVLLQVFIFCLLVHSVSGADKTVIGDKTLVAWVTPANLSEKGGSVLTIEKGGGAFDAIVFGELATGRWMAGSNNHSRTQKPQSGAPETSTGTRLVQIAIVYREKQITVYRNSQKYAQYTTGGAERFDTESMILIGLRHRDAAAANRFFTGSIDDVRIYNRALSQTEVAALLPNKLTGAKPLAWWNFERGTIADQMNTFPATILVGGARVHDGRLHLDKSGAHLMATKDVPKLGPPRAGSKNVDKTARALRERLLSDPHRPGYHFTIPEGRGMPFDPNGAIFWKGRYHLFYIFQDERGHNWGHVSSTDLFHWRHHPTDLVSGMFSGNCFINKDGRPTMCYHQVGQGNAMAVAIDDNLDHWEKLASNPITPRTTGGDAHHGKYRSWDPFGWLEGDTYYAIFGGQRPAIAKSPTLGGKWNYVGDLMANTVDDVSINEDVSCADLFKLGDKHMLLCISHRLGCRYYLGDWRDEAFHPTFHEKMSWIDNSFFAPESLLDDKGRRIMWAWIFDAPGFKTRMDYGWSGTMSLPRVLTLGDDGMLRMNVPKEIEQLRYNAKSKRKLVVEAGTDLVLDDIQGNSLELDIEISSKDAQQFGVKVCLSPDGSEQTLIYYDAKDKQLKIDTRKSSATGGPKGIEAGPLQLADGESLKLHILIDKSVVEVFANGRQAVMRRIYPTDENSTGVALFSNGGSANVKRVDAWDIMPSNPY